MSETTEAPAGEILQIDPASIRQIALSVVQESSHSGPLPSAEQYRQYEEILPGAAERILRMAEKEQDGRLEWQRKALDASIRFRHRGQTFAGILAGLFVLVAVLLVALQQYIPAVTVLGMIAALAGVFISGRYGKATKDETDPP